MFALSAVASAAPSGGLARVPPMGWMSWQAFRCEIDCKAAPEDCIDEHLYKSVGDAMVAGKYAAAGYTGVHIDDCWEAKPRDASGRLQPNSTRFPSGIDGLASYLHSGGLTLGIYSDEGTATCKGYPGSKGFEEIDAQTFADWGVDYLKLDGCANNISEYDEGYTAFGHALRSPSLSRQIAYSCSWPAYLGDDEPSKPYDRMIAAGCNLWRNWHDIQCNFHSLSSIIDHFAAYSVPLQRVGGPGHWNDPDMLLVGATDRTTGQNCLSTEQERTNMAVWCMLAAPLIMGNDVRNVSAASAEILLHADAIAINQDPRGEPGVMLNASSTPTQQVWARNLTSGHVAVALYNRGDGKAAGAAAPIGFTFAAVGLGGAGSVCVYDVWARRSLGSHTGGFTAPSVALHDTAFFRLWREQVEGRGDGCYYWLYRYV